MALEETGRLNDSLAAQAANVVASGEDIQELIDGAEVVIESRKLKEQRRQQRREQQRGNREDRLYSDGRRSPRNKQSFEQAARERIRISPRLQQRLEEQGFDLNNLQLGDSDLFYDRETEAFGQNQDDSQTYTADDARFEDTSLRPGEIAFFNPDIGRYDIIEIPDGVSDVEKYLDTFGFDPDREGYSKDARKAILARLNSQGKGKYEQTDKAKKPEAKYGGKPRLFVRNPDGTAGREITAAQAKRQGIATVTKTDYREDSKRYNEPAVRGQSSGGAYAARGAIERLEKALAEGKITLDDVIDTGNTVGVAREKNPNGLTDSVTSPGRQTTVRELLGRLRRADGTERGGRAQARADRQAGLREVEANRRIAEGRLTRQEAARVARRINIEQGLVGGDDPSIGNNNEYLRDTDGMPATLRTPKGFEGPAPIDAVRAMRGAENIEEDATPRFSGTGEGGSISRGRPLDADDVLFSLEEQAGTVREKRAANAAEALRIKLADRNSRNPAKYNLRNAEEISPGGVAYVKNEGSEDQRTFALADEIVDSTPPEQAFAVDGFSADSNLDVSGKYGIGKAKLNDYRIVDPDDPSTWRAADLPVAQEVGLSPGRMYLDADGNPIGDDTVPMRNANTPDTANGLNAPQAPNTVQEYAAQVIKQRQSAERMRQVGIGPAIDILGAKYANWAGDTKGITPFAAPRTIEDLDTLVRYVEATQRQMPLAPGKKSPFYQFKEGKSVPTSTPTAQDILINTLGLTPDESENLLQAVVMTDAARDTKMPVDASPMARMAHAEKEAFFEGKTAGRTPGANPGANNVAGEIKTIPDNKQVVSFNPLDPMMGPRAMGFDAVHNIAGADSTERIIIDGKTRELGGALRALQGTENLDDLDASERRKVIQGVQEKAIGRAKGDEKAEVFVANANDPYSPEQIRQQERLRRQRFVDEDAEKDLKRAPSKRKNRSMDDPAEIQGMEESIDRRLRGREQVANTEIAMARAAQRQQAEDQQAADRLNRERAFIADAKDRAGAVEAARNEQEREEVRRLLLGNEMYGQVNDPPLDASAFGGNVKFKERNDLTMKDLRKAGVSEMPTGSRGGGSNLEVAGPGGFNRAAPRVREVEEATISEPLVGGQRVERQAIREAAVVPSIAPDPVTPTGNQMAPVVDAGIGEPGSRGSVARRALTERGPRISAFAQELKKRDSAAKQEAGLERLRERDAINNRSARIAGIAQSMRDEASIFGRAEESALAERRAMQASRAKRNAGRREKVAAGREQQRNFRRGIRAGGAGAAAILGGILGLSNMDREEEQQY